MAADFWQRAQNASDEETASLHFVTQVKTENNASLRHGPKAVVLIKTL